jgi:hypothetical protein
VWYNAYVTGASSFTEVPLTWLWVCIGVLGGVLLLLGAAYAALRLRGALPPLFRPRAAVAVHNPLVQRPVVVRCEALDVARLHRDAPELAAFVDDLPPGVVFGCVCVRERGFVWRR